MRNFSDFLETLDTLHPMFVITIFVIFPGVLVAGAVFIVALLTGALHG